MAFVTRGQLLRAARPLTEGRAKVATTLSVDRNVFLSHSRFDDMNVVRGALAVLEAHRAKVYVDQLDGAIATMSTSEQCSHLHTVIHHCKRLVVLFSENTHTSRWIPWELGLGDGIHGAACVATLPVAQASREEPWGKQEYFGLYPQIRIETLRGYEKPQYVVHNPKTSRFWTLARWLSR